MNGKYAIKDFIDKARKVHGDKYDYTKVEYVDSQTKVCIICPIHGEFWQRPASHLSGIGCRKCSYLSSQKKNTKTTEEFITQAQQVHGDKYDYTKVEYINAHTKVCIICPIHGEFWQQPVSHLSGIGCKQCGFVQIQEKNRSTVDNFVKKAKEVHGDKYDYSKVEYVNNKTKICIICKEHGEFWQTPDTHLRGGGCRKCSNNILRQNRLISTSDYINRCKSIHGDRYDYSKTNYQGYAEKVCIICPIHGEFWQLAYNHTQGKGCPICSTSKLELEIKQFLEEKQIRFIHQYRPQFLINGKSHLSIDFYLIDYNIGIECQGRQHFEGNTFYSQNIKKIIERDKLKKEMCYKNGIQIFYYSNIKNETYFDRVYYNKEELLNDIQNGKKRLL